MRVKTVTFGRVKTANYQSQRAEVTVELEPEEDVDKAFAKAKTLVDVELDGRPSDAEVKKAEEVLRRARS